MNFVERRAFKRLVTMLDLGPGETVREFEIGQRGFLILPSPDFPLNPEGDQIVLAATDAALHIVCGRRRARYPWEQIAEIRSDHSAGTYWVKGLLVDGETFQVNVGRARRPLVETAHKTLIDWEAGLSPQDRSDRRRRIDAALGTRRRDHELAGRYKPCRDGVARGWAEGVWISELNLGGGAVRPTGLGLAFTSPSTRAVDELMAWDNVEHFWIDASLPDEIVRGHPTVFADPNMSWSIGGSASRGGVSDGLRFTVHVPARSELALWAEMFEAFTGQAPTRTDPIATESDTPQLEAVAGLTQDEVVAAAASLITGITLDDLRSQLDSLTAADFDRLASWDSHVDQGRAWSAVVDSCRAAGEADVLYGVYDPIFDRVLARASSAGLPPADATAAARVAGMAAAALALQDRISPPQLLVLFKPWHECLD